MELGPLHRDPLLVAEQPDLRVEAARGVPALARAASVRPVRKVLPENRFSSVLQRVVDLATLACGWWLLALSAITCVEILGRKFFGFSLQGVDEIGSYTFAIVTGFGSNPAFCASPSRRCCWSSW